MSILWLGGALPGTDSPVFFQVRELAFAAVTASMIAYLIAQMVDVQLFHFWKRLTGGKHLWLRNNGSTLVSQLVDTVAVILITHYYAHGLPIDPDQPIDAQLMTFIGAGYTYKVVTALLDTGPFYLGAHRLSRWMRLPPPGHREGSEPSA
jgi:uncharacterized integral membrane protein (TIGR00697 family)